MMHYRKPPRPGRRPAFWLVALLVLLFPSPALRAEEDTGRGISINLVDADIGFVLRALMEASKANIVFQGTITGPVTCQIQDQPLERILDVLTRSNNLFWHKEDGIYIITKTPVAPPAAPAAVAPPVSKPADPIPTVPAATGTVVLDPPKSVQEVQPRAPLHMAKYPLMYSDARTICYMLGRGTDPGLELMNMWMPMQPQMPTPMPLGTYPNGYPGSNAAPLGMNPGGGLAELMATRGIARSAFPGSAVPGMGGMSGSSPYPNQFPGGMGFGGGFGGGFPGGGGFNPGGAGGVGGQGNNITGGLMDLIPAGIDKIIPYPLDNSILVLGTDEAIQQLRELIKMLDRPAKQVRIEAEFLTVTRGDADNFGFSWMMSDGTTEVNADLSSSGDMNIRFAKGNFATAIQAFKSSHKGRTIIAPRITCPNNQMGMIQASHSSVFFVPGSAGGGPFGAPPSPPTPQVMQVPIMLSVVPRINGDNSVTIFAQPTVTDIVGTVDSPAGGSIPITDTQAVNCPGIRVKDGETLVLGGMVRRTESTSNHHLPWLSDLPLIGNLFKNNNHAVDDSELLIFMTPHVLPGDEVLEATGSSSVSAMPVGGASPAPVAPVGGGGAAPAPAPGGGFPGIPALPGGGANPPGN